MRSVQYLKKLLPLSFKHLAKDALVRAAGIETTLSALTGGVRAMVEEAEAARAVLAELAHRTDYLKLNVEHLEVRLRDLTDEVETLNTLKRKVATLEIELANCRNVAEVAFQAAEALQFGTARTGT
jgi:hypothetical protein